MVSFSAHTSQWDICLSFDSLKHWKRARTFSFLTKPNLKDNQNKMVFFHLEKKNQCFHISTWVSVFLAWLSEHKYINSLYPPLLVNKEPWENAPQLVVSMCSSIQGPSNKAWEFMVYGHNSNLTTELLASDCGHLSFLHFPTVSPSQQLMTSLPSTKEVCLPTSTRISAAVWFEWMEGKSYSTKTIWLSVLIQ